MYVKVLAPPAPIPVALSPADDIEVDANSVRSLEIPGVLLKLQRNFVAAGSASTYKEKSTEKCNLAISVFCVIRNVFHPSILELNR